MTASDPRLTGRRRILVDGAFNADGTARLWGLCYQEVGTWSESTFTPSGGVWEIRYTGTMGTNYSLQAHLIGTGTGGTIDGLRFTETMTRAPSLAPVDPGQPYQYAGHIDSGPTVTRQVVDAFPGPSVSAWSDNGTGAGHIRGNNGALIVRGHWPGIVTRQHADSWYWGYRQSDWEVADGRTLEWRVDLLGMTEGSTNAAGLILANNGSVSFYALYKGARFIQLGKYHDNQMSVLFHEDVSISNTNVTLSLVLSRVQSSLILTGRVLDRSNPDTVLRQRTFVDTPKPDRTLTQAELLAASGMNLIVAADASGAPLMGGSTVCLDAWQYTDGAQPALEVIYDNLEMRTYDTPQLAIEPSVTLLVPSPFDLEQAPGVDGPWTPVVESSLDGIQRISVPSRDPAALFRTVVRP